MNFDDLDAMFSSSDPWERWAAHQAAKGNTVRLSTDPDFEQDDREHDTLKETGDAA